MVNMPYQMKNGKWRAERQIDGKRFTHTCETRREALDWESEVKKRQEIEEVTRTVTALEWINQYLDYSLERNVSVVYKAKKRVAGIALSVIGRETPVTEIKPALALAAMRQAAKVGCADTGNLCRKHLSSAWNWGIKFAGLPPLNPFHQVEKFAVDQKPRPVPTESEFWKVVCCASERDKRFLIACLHTAARKSELFRLTWNDVDFERGFILLGTRKRKGGGMEYDPIPMTTELRRILLEQKEEGLGGERVFCHTDGNPYTSRQNLIKRLCKKCGAPHFSPHSIRHLTASILAREGVPLFKIGAILRHKSLSTTEEYIARISPLENVLEGVLGKWDWIDADSSDPVCEGPHGGPHAYAETQKLQ
jgi:integrase